MAKQDTLWANRIKDYRTVKASEFLDHNLNWRVHPEAQSTLTKASLDEHGIFMPLVAYQSKARGGLTLLNGHDRVKLSPPEQEWPVAILDVDDGRAEEILFLIDSIPEMATANENLARLQQRFANKGDDNPLMQFANHMLIRHGISTDDENTFSILGTSAANGGSDDDGQRDRTDGGSSLQKMQHDGKTKTFTFGDVMVMLPVDLYYDFEAWVDSMIESGDYENKAEVVEIWMTTALEALVTINGTQK